MVLTSDAQTMVMLCTRLGMAETGDHRPFSLTEWNGLARRLVDRGCRPSQLLGMSSADVEQDLGLDPVTARRIAALLDRAVAVAFELERLESQGIWVWTRADPAYPAKYRQRLKDQAPPVLFGSGSRDLPGQPGLAIVGSRDVNAEGQAFAEEIGRQCAHEGLVVYSGGARGVDSCSMKSALHGRGYAVGVLAHSLSGAIREPGYRSALHNGNLTLLTALLPDAGFKVWNAMERNKLIYCLADYALVVASDHEKGGTWAGAIENLKNAWIPTFVFDGDAELPGNKALLQKGGIKLRADQNGRPTDGLRSWLQAQSADFKKPPSQPALL